MLARRPAVWDDRPPFLRVSQVAIPPLGRRGKVPSAAVATLIGVEIVTLEFVGRLGVEPSFSKARPLFVCFLIHSAQPLSSQRI